MADKPTLLDRLLNRVEKRADGCWIWTGALNKAGYAYRQRRAVSA